MNKEHKKVNRIDEPLESQPLADPPAKKSWRSKIVEKSFMENQKPITAETAESYRLKGLQTRLANKAARERFQLTAKAFLEMKASIPELRGIDVLQMCMVQAIDEGNTEDAARYAAQLAEYQDSKKARLETVNLNITKDMTDEELRRIMREEGLTTDPDVVDV